MKTLLFLGMGVCALLLLASALLPQTPTNAAGFARHGTPDPNATPEVTGEDVAYVPTYHDDVEPILATHCLQCHTEGGIGAERIVLSDPAIVQTHAEDIAFVTGTRYMPPWLPGELSPPLKHTRTLTEDEIKVLDAWYLGGAPLGEEHDHAVEAVPAPETTFRADVTVQLPEPYTPGGDLNDEYRCFLLDPQLAQSTYITGYFADPDQDSIVHHVLVFHLPKRYQRDAERLDKRDDRPGWECFGSSGVGEETVIGAWAPGTQPVEHPAGTGYPIEAGDLFVIQVHYFLDAGPKPDQTRVMFQLAAPGETLQPLYTTILTAPVEIPCSADVDTEDCTREGAIKYAERYYGAASRRQANDFLTQCGKTEDDYVHQDAAHVVSDCEMTLPLDVTVVDVLPHMHTRGTSIRLEVNPDTPDAQIMIDIPHWDFHWQGVFQYETPIQLHKGDILRLTCTWDNTHDASPRYILWGEGTQDEMCLSYFTIIVPQEG